ncbi:hypothetical protein M885DRAFT_590292 [Pelagophyceae sp. CCMP2097]|nr:hypothetical protein M885DRAFT_590292 [Pelagophyceae sp. CCMP2097]
MLLLLSALLPLASRRSALPVRRAVVSEAPCEAFDGAAALEALEALTFEAVGGRALLDACRHRCATARGAERFDPADLAAVLRPRRADDVQALYEAVALVADVLPPEARTGCDARIDGASERALAAAAGAGNLGADDLVAVANALDALFELRAAFDKARPAAALRVYAAPIMGQSLDVADSCGLRGAFEFFEGRRTARLDARLCDDLRRARDAAAAARAALDSDVAAFRREGALTGADSKLKRGLKSGDDADLFELEKGRFVVTVGAKYTGGVDRAAFHNRGASRSGRTLYLEPKALRRAADALDAAAQREADAEAARLAECTRAVGRVAVPLRACAEAAADVDALRARALVGFRDLCGVVPDVRDARLVDMRGARSPLLALKARGAAVEANALRAAPSTALLLSGPNGGGKTTALATLGLAAFMVRLGVPLAAAAARVDVFDCVIGDVGGSASRAFPDNSTFEAHMRFCRAAVASCRPRHTNARVATLVLFDEIGASTDHEEGGALAHATLEALVDAGATVAATTHHSRLRTLPVLDAARYRGLAFECDAAGVPTFRATDVPFGRSRAFDAAERCGLDGTVVARAKELHRAESGDSPRDGDDVLWLALEEARRAADAERAAAEADRAAFAGLRCRLDADRAAAVDGAKRQAQAALLRVVRREKQLDALFAALQTSAHGADAAYVIGTTIAKARVASRGSRRDRDVAVLAAAGLRFVRFAAAGDTVVLPTFDAQRGAVVATVQAHVVSFDPKQTICFKLRVGQDAVDATLEDVCCWDFDFKGSGF